MVQIANMNKSSSNYEIFSKNLQNLANQFVSAIAKTLNSTTAASFMSTLENQKANLFLADISSGSPIIVCNVIPASPAAFACNPTSTANSNSILSLSDQFKITPPTGGTSATISLSPAGTPEANASTLAIDPSLTPTINFTQTSYSSNGATATYGLTIDVQMCGSLSGTSVCQKATVPTNFTFTRTCPNAGKSLDSPGKTMRALTNAEIKILGGGQYTNNNTFPNLYCTCADPSFVTTNSSGTCLACSGSSPYWNGTICAACPANATCSNGTITGCQSGYYGSNCTQCQTGIISGTWPSQTCQTCPTSTSICSNGAISGCQSGYYYDGSNCTQCLGGNGVISGTWPNQTCQSCPSNSICSNGAISGCQSGYYGSTCIQCPTGVISGTWPSQTCQSCPSTAICSNGAISGCQISYYGATCVSKCQGVVSGSWPSATCAACSGSTPYWNGSNCAACPANAVCSNGAITGCSSGFSLVSGACTCSTGYITGSGSTAVCNSCPIGAICSGGAITSCSSGFSLVSGACSCSAGYITGSGSTAVCNPCPSGNTCSGGAITGCTNGFSLVGGTCKCSTGYLTGSGSTAVCNACPSANTCSGGAITGCCASGCGYICVCYERNQGYSNLNCYVVGGSQLISINAATDCNYVCANMPILGYPWAAYGGYPACGGGKSFCRDYYAGCLSSPPGACLCPAGTTVSGP